MPNEETLKEELRLAQRTLKRIKEQKAQLTAQQVKLNDEQREVKKRVTDMTQALSEKNRRPKITDHALIRYLERVYGFDLEQVREDLMTDDVKSAIKMGAKSVKVDGYTLVVKDYAVVTIKG